MRQRPRWPSAAVRAFVVAALGVWLSAPPVHAAQERLEGRLLADALRWFQSHGLPIVFSSAIVTPAMRVIAEPRGSTLRQQLDDLLAPHGLRALDGPGGTIQILPADRQATTSRPRPPESKTGRIEGRVLHRETQAPLAGAEIVLQRTGRRARADAAGRFSFAGVRTGEWMLLAATPGYDALTAAVEVTADAPAMVVFDLLPRSGGYSEHVTVTRPLPVRQDRGLTGEASLDQTELTRHGELLIDDPMRAVHALPRVAAVDDFSAEFSVRGSPYRHLDVVVDGVSAEALRHSFPGPGAGGSLGMFTSGVIAKATLRAGAYPRRHGNRLGPQLELTMREGSRNAVGVRGMVGGSFSAVIGEGPLGREERGSWLLAARQSYAEWPAVRPGSTRKPFEFSDVSGKLVYDISASQQIDFSVLRGTSGADEDEASKQYSPVEGTNQATMASLVWRSRLGRTSLRQQAYVVSQQLSTTLPNPVAGEASSNAALAYRADVIRPVARGVLELGARLDRQTSPNRSFDEGAAYVHLAWVVAPAITVSPGARVSTSTLSSHRPLSAWLLGEWVLSESWTLNASAGVSHQWPDWRALQHAGADLVPARAVQVDVSIERRLQGPLWWQASVYSRRERDVNDPGGHPRILAARIDLSLPSVLNGRSHGLEVLVDRRSDSGLSGWASYSYGKSRYAADSNIDESFWADFDQRHAMTLAARYALFASTGLGMTFRAGTSFPIPGYFEKRGDRLFVSSQRNQVRLPVHARLDLRGDRTMTWLGRRVTLAGEVLNLLNHRNLGLGNGELGPSDEAVGFTETLLGRRASASLMIQF